MSDCIYNNGIQEIDIDKIIELSSILLFQNNRNSLYNELINIIKRCFKVKKILIIEVMNKNFEVVVEWKDQCGEEKIINNDSENFEVFHPLIYDKKLIGIVFIEKNASYSNIKLKMLKLICIQVASVMKKIDAEEVKVQKIKNELRESEEGYKRLFELSPDAICVHSNGKIVLANPETGKLFDMKNPKGMIGRDIMDFVHPSCNNTVKSRMKKIYEGGMVTPFIEEKVFANDGSIIEVEVGTSTFKYMGKPVILVVARNINQRKKWREN
ncbi:PAS domain S-box protein [Clostridium sp.]|jgi:PAS domain S-box-containing protein|uniref:PAS domain S-box protein n=1 Tax=Clostridium sp. TaxID=1506 RepID=UPI003EEEDD93